MVPPQFWNDAPLSWLLTLFRKLVTIFYLFLVDVVNFKKGYLIRPVNLVSQKIKKTLLKPSLEKIAEDLRAGRLKEENFRILFEDFYPKLFNFFANHGVFQIEDIRDLIQNVFFKVYKNIEQCRDCQKFGSWIFRIARNEMIDWFRKKRGKQTKSLDAAADSDKPENQEEIKSESDLLQEAINQEQLDKLSSAIQKLPKRMQQCFQMFYRKNYSYKEIATALRIGEETVKSQLYQGRKRLKELLGDEIDF